MKTRGDPTLSIFDVPVSLFGGAMKPTPKQTLSIEDILSRIRGGTYKAQINRLRKLPEKAYSKQKRNLQAVTFVGTFSPKRGKEYFQQHSGFAIIDLDHLNGNLAEIKDKICEDKHVSACFVSPSGAGLKALVRIPFVKDDPEYKRILPLIKEYFQTEYNVDIDFGKDGKDVSRLCFVSYDPDLYQNENAVIFPVSEEVLHPPETIPTQEQEKSKTKIKTSSSVPGDSNEIEKVRERRLKLDIETAQRLVSDAPKGGQHEARLNAGNLLGGVIGGYGSMLLSEEEACNLIMEHDQGEDRKAVKKTIIDGIAYGKQHHITTDETILQDWEEYKVKHPLKNNDNGKQKTPHPAGPESTTEKPKGKHTQSGTVSNAVRKAALDVLAQRNAGLFDEHEKLVKFMLACKAEGLSYSDIDAIVKKSKGYDQKKNEMLYESLRPEEKTTFGYAVKLAKQLDKELYQTRRKYYKSLEGSENMEGLGPATRMSLVLNKMYKLTYNKLTEKVQVDGEPITDPLSAKIYCELVDLGFKNQHLLDQVILKEAYKNTYHPVYVYFESLKWDKKQRLCATILTDYFEDKDGLFWILVRKWMVGAIEKAYTGKQNPMLVLVGAQGSGKSNFVQWLCPIEGMFIESAIYPDSNDHTLRLTDKFVWEVGELGSTTRRRDIDALKAFLTKEIVTVRRPWDKYDRDKSALASFIGTVNDDGVGFLNDPTGNRRFRACHLTSINWSYKQELDVNQLWAEAYELYRQKETNTIARDVNDIMQIRMKEFEYADPVEDIILDEFVITSDPAHLIKNSDALMTIKQSGYRGSTSHAESIALARAMKKLGVNRYRSGGIRYFQGIRYKGQYEK